MSADIFLHSERVDDKSCLEALSGERGNPAAKRQFAVATGGGYLTRMVLGQASEVTPTFGIELVDVQFKRINYNEDVRTDVYDRMISERKRIAERSRSEGQGRSAKIRGQRSPLRCPTRR